MIFALVSSALAESWCAAPLLAHEWGVTVLGDRSKVDDRPSVPDWFHHSGQSTESPVPVRTLPADSGERDLPVVQFYSVPVWGNAIPIGLEVGFRDGEASTWFPKVDRAQPAQLSWDRLILSPKPLSKPIDSDEPWVVHSRSAPDALWVNSPGESDRYLFYEAHTRESSALVLEAGDSAKPEHFLLHNTSDRDVFDVVFVHDGRTWTAPRIPAGKTAGFLLQDRFDPVATRSWLTESWTDSSGIPQLSRADCVMMRDPSVPARETAGHRLFPAELEALWSAWESALLAPTGTRILYRESTEALDKVMPIALYTDMYHDPRLRRLGVVWVVNPPLP